MTATAAATELRARARKAYEQGQRQVEIEDARKADEVRLQLGRSAERLARSILGLGDFGDLSFESVKVGEYTADFRYDGILFRVSDDPEGSGPMLFIVDNYEDTGREFIRRIWDLGDVGRYLHGLPMMDPQRPGAPKSEKDIGREIAEDLGVIPGQAPEWFLQYQMRVSHHVAKLHTRMNELHERLKYHDETLFPVK